MPAWSAVRSSPASPPEPVPPASCGKRGANVFLTAAAILAAYVLAILFLAAAMRQPEPPARDEEIDLR